MKNFLRELLKPKRSSEVTLTKLQELTLLQPFMMGDIKRAENLYELASDMKQRDIPGDFVECGVYQGGSAATIALALKGTGRTTWLYDSFQGMPASREIDGPEAGEVVGKCVGSEEKVHEAMKISGYEPSQYHVRKGWFKDTFIQDLPSKVSFLHIDADWYDSVILSLNTFYDRVSEGGIIVLDDFGHWEGCREAYYDFVCQKRIKPLLERFNHTVAYWIKGRTNNRRYIGQDLPLETVFKKSKNI